jgi:hypothetical protein
MKNLQELKEKFDQKQDLKKLKTSLKIEELKNERELQEQINKTLILKTESEKLKLENSIDNKIKKSGLIIKSLGFLSFIVSTILSILSLQLIIENTISFVGFGSLIIVCQLIIFVSAKYSYNVRTYFFNSYNALKLLQLLMLFVSVCLNVEFVYGTTNNYIITIILLPLCLILDYSTIYFSALGSDFRELNKNDNSYNVSIFEMILNNLCYNFTQNVITKYNKNHGVITESENVITELEQCNNEVITENENVITQPERLIMKKEDLISIYNLTIVENYLNENYLDGSILKSKEIQDYFNLTSREWSKLKSKLNCVEVKGTKTFFKKQSLLLVKGGI